MISSSIAGEIESHELRVSSIACNFSQHLAVNTKIMSKIYQASKIHDIGKYFIDSELLSKRGKLTEEEIEEIRSHVTRGVDYLISKKTDKKIVEIVSCHHESYDGSGYPNGISKEDIPYESRIIKICDVYDALTHKRDYRKVIYSKEKALEIMNSMDNEFDPKLFLEFKNYLKIIMIPNNINLFSISH